MKGGIPGNYGPDEEEDEKRSLGTVNGGCPDGLGPSPASCRLKPSSLGRNGGCPINGTVRVRPASRMATET